jgi:triosephosphate isomerase
MRKPVMAGNWKMYKTAAETTQFFEKFLPLVKAAAHCEVVICPVYVNLPAAVAAAHGSNVQIGAQDVFWEKEGAFTGEVAAPMIRAVGCSHVIIGHSERRQYFGETNEWVLKKTAAALEAGLTPIVCVGETLAERESGHTAAVLTRQFEEGIAPLTAAQFAHIIIAYEPVWAIGTGQDRHTGDCGRCAPGDPRTGAGTVRGAGGRGRPYPVRRQRQARQCQESDGSARDRWGPGGRRQSETGFLRFDRQLLMASRGPDRVPDGLIRTPSPAAMAAKLRRNP